jgi:uncharacterized protein YnzC (UPF0291/DUF896 family)
MMTRQQLRKLARLAKKEKGPPFEMQGKLDLKVKYKIIDKHGKDVTKERAHAFSS